MTLAWLQASTSILGGHGDESTSIGRVWWLMFAMAAGVYVLVAGLVIAAILRGRRRERAEEPDSRRDDRFLWLGGLALPVVILAVLAVVTVTTTKDLRRVSSREVRIEVTGKRWWWDVRYPAEQVEAADEVHVPVGEPVDVALTSSDVIHSFWVPELAGKVDMVPGQVNHLRFTATQAGTYRGECAEYCAIGHANMAFLVVAEAPADFQRWLARRESPAGQVPTDEQAAQGEVVFQREPCGGCHTVAGTDAKGTRGPALSDVGSRRTLAAGTIPNTPDELARWIRDPQEVKPGVLMPPSPQLSDADVRALVAYLEGLR